MAHPVRTEPSAVREIASGLRFPEGPVALADGSILVVEIAGKALTRIASDGSKRVVAELEGGPNGAAIGPDGRCYVCNNGGFVFAERDGRLYPGLTPPDYRGGWIEAVDLETGRSEILYRGCGERPLLGPNDLVFDRHGGFYFTDPGKIRRHSRDRGTVYYARADGSAIRKVVFPVEGANGIGLSPDGATLYVAEAHAGRIWAFDIVAPGEIAKTAGALPWERGRMLFAASHYALFDSLAIDAEGNVCVADIPHGGITVVSPAGELVEQHPMPEPMPTNICFGGPGLKTAYVTLSSTGKLVSLPWPRGGLPLHFLNT